MGQGGSGEGGAIPPYGVAPVPDGGVEASTE
jgi:hypothetical protein